MLMYLITASEYLQTKLWAKDEEALFFFFFFLLLFIYDSHTEREREAETQAEGEAGSPQGA